MKGASAKVASLELKAAVLETLNSVGDCRLSGTWRELFALAATLELTR
jgi:hypothetical protein